MSDSASEETRALAAAIRRRLGPAPELRPSPSVSAVVVNRDGAPHLRTLLDGLIRHTDYPKLELIVVDNASSDESLQLLRDLDAPFPVTSVSNSSNESFSDSCNQGAARASGDLLLFLNNDIEPFEPGWLRELVACLVGSNAGAAAATLVCREEEHEREFPFGYGVQHRGLLFREEEGRMVPGLRGWEEDPLDDQIGVDASCQAVAAACLLIARRTYGDLGGFSPGYFYGCEDVDLSLKIRARGRAVLCSGRAIVIHHPASTRRRVPFEDARKAKLANLELLWERWGADLGTTRTVS